MTNYLLTYRSLTYAQRTSRLLERAGTGVSIVRTPQEISTEGCGYALKIKERDLERALAVLKASDAYPKRIFRSCPDGRYEAVSV